MEKELYVKTYDLCTGEIKIGDVQCIYDEDKNIDCWRGIDEFYYKGKEEVIKIKTNTMIWDKRNKRYVMSYNEDRYNGCACFSTIVIDKSNILETLLVDEEKVKYCWSWR